jgi:MYXO-CTERM domain-containing protein
VFAVHVAPAAVGLIALFLAGLLRERQQAKPAARTATGT